MIVFCYSVLRRYCSRMKNCSAHQRHESRQKNLQYEKIMILCVIIAFRTFLFDRGDAEVSLPLVQSFTSLTKNICVLYVNRRSPTEKLPFWVFGHSSKINIIWSLFLRLIKNSFNQELSMVPQSLLYRTSYIRLP